MENSAVDLNQTLEEHLERLNRQAALKPGKFETVLGL